MGPSTLVRVGFMPNPELTRPDWMVRIVGYISTIYFVIKQKEQHIDLNISNKTNRYDRQKQNIIYKKKSTNN